MSDFSSNGGREFVSVVIPVYREGNHLRQVLAAVRSALVTAEVAYQIVVVDDGSPDDT